MNQQQQDAVELHKGEILDFLVRFARQLLPYLEEKNVIDGDTRSELEESKVYDRVMMQDTLSKLKGIVRGWAGLIDFIKKKGGDSHRLVDLLEAGSIQMAADAAQQSGTPIGNKPTVQTGDSASGSSLHRDANQSSLLSYKVRTEPRGLALIINNQIFDDASKNRGGSEHDMRRSVELWKGLHYEVIEWSNLKKRELQAAVKKFANDPRHKRFDSAVVVLMTHGTTDVLEGVDGKTVEIEHLVRQLNAVNCPSLKEKPKLILLQACRGALKDEGVVDSDGPDVADAISKRFSWLRLEEYDSDEPDKIPTYADILIGFATTPGNVSWRLPRTGSWYIQEICDVFDKHHTDEHVADMLAEVGNNISLRTAKSKKQSNEYKQISVIESTLRKKFYIL